VLKVTKLDALTLDGFGLEQDGFGLRRGDFSLK